MSNEPALTDVAVQVADGLAVDWARAESESPDPSHRVLLQRLRIVERVAQVHAGLSPAESSLQQSLLHPFASAPERDRDTPVTWGPLTIVDKIGRGTFGDVYRARDPKLDRPVALKLLRRRERNADAVEQAVIEEGRLMARVRHPNVVTIYGAERVDGRVGLWMELVDGHTLEEELREHGPSAADDVLRIGVDLSAALAAVHRAGLLHRDLKAQNVMRDVDGRILLTDFGAGRELTQDTESTGPELAGTPLYLAPEVLGGSAASPQSDLYSLGVLLYHLATGSFPVRGRTLRDLRDAHARGTRTSLREVRPDLPRAVVTAVDRALSAEPHDRHQTAVEFGQALAAVATRRRRHAYTVAAAVLTTTAVGVTVFALASRRGLESSHAAGIVPAAAGVARSQTPPAGSHEPSITLAAESLTFKEHDSVLVTRFDNRTGETVLDGALEVVFVRELANSPFVSVAPRERIDDVLLLMGRAADTVVDVALGRAIALRDGGVRALLSGQVEKVGRGYVLNVRIIHPATGAVIRSLDDAAADPAELPDAVRRQALRVREELGETPVTIRASEVALGKVTTPSLRALHLYSQASAFMHGDHWNHAASEMLLRQAIAEDPTFASAHILLAWAVRNQSRPKEEWAPHAARALELAGSTPDAERYFIIGSYHDLLSGRWENRVDSEQDKTHLQKAIDAYEALMRIQPNHYWAVFNLASAYALLNKEPEASLWYGRLAEVRSNSGLDHLTAAEHFLRAGDVPRARVHFARARALPPVPGSNRDLRLEEWEATEAWLAQDVPRLLKQAVRLEQQPEAEFLQLKSSLYVGLGRFGDAERLFPDSNYMWGARAWLGDPRALVYRERRRERIPIETMFRMTDAALYPFIVSQYVREGDLERARRIATLAKAVFASGEPARQIQIRAFYLSAKDVVMGDGHIAVADGKLDDAVVAFQIAAQSGAWGVELLRMASELAGGWRGRGDLQQATTILEEATTARQRGAIFFDHRSGPAYWVAVRNELAELYDATGRFNEAKAIDDELLKLLSVADQDHPVLLKINARKQR